MWWIALLLLLCVVHGLVDVQREFEIWEHFYWAPSNAQGEASAWEVCLSRLKTRDRRIVTVAHFYTARNVYKCFNI